MAKRNRWTKQDSMLVLWCLSERNRLREEYYKACRQKCLAVGTKENERTWNEILRLRREMKYNGFGDDEIGKVEIEAYRSITEEEILSVCG